MQSGIQLRDANILIKLENCSMKIIDGNFGVFQHSFTKHMHSYYELHYVSGGQGTLVTDELEMPLCKGCFYLLPPRTNHEQWSNPKDYLKEYHLAFELVSKSEDDFIWIELLSKGYYASNQNEIEAFFGNLANEFKQMQYGYTETVIQNIQSIFITLIRSLGNRNNMAVTPCVNLDDKRIMIIDEAFLFNYKSITLALLSEQLNLSTRQTQRFINDKYGVPFSTLKFQSRLSHSAMLLSTTDLTIEEICFQVGYKNYSFFNRAFREYYNMTPMKYRKTHLTRHFSLK